MEFIAGNKEEFIPIATGNRKNYINTLLKSWLVVSLINMARLFSGVETSAVVIRSILLCTVTVRVFTSVSKSFHQVFFQVALILTR
ncbi:hypothetical protein BSPWISOXPB_5168 [uncultured Gammaproteobacteria bacterium]|nr:hypothetical protein BSPWISOXPB_5168 [uncultured Gammaproteobacteria bacterium]